MSYLSGSAQTWKVVLDLYNSYMGTQHTSGFTNLSLCGCMDLVFGFIFVIFLRQRNEWMLL